MRRPPPAHQHAKEASATSEVHRRSHDRHAGHGVARFRDKLLITLLLTVPTLVWGHMLPRLLRFEPPAVPGAHWIPPLFGTAVFLYGGWPFIRGAIDELRDRLPGMMTLIGLAISVAFGYSGAVTLGVPGMPLWEELSTLGHDHAAGSLDRDAIDPAGRGRARGAREAPA